MDRAILHSVIMNPRRRLPLFGRLQSDVETGRFISIFRQSSAAGHHVCRGNDVRSTSRGNSSCRLKTRLSMYVWAYQNLFFYRDNMIAIAAGLPSGCDGSDEDGGKDVGVTGSMGKGK